MRVPAEYLLILELLVTELLRYLTLVLFIKTINIGAIIIFFIIICMLSELRKNKKKTLSVKTLLS